jgi:2-isopropylmalate synthase
MGYDLGLDRDGLEHLTATSRMLDERLNRPPARNAAYVGLSAFAHKGGLHVSAIEKDARTYEHVPPEIVGNERHIVVSDQAGRSNILARFREIGLAIESSNAKVPQLLDLVKEREHQGYTYDGAEASFELLARRIFGEVPEYFRVASFRVLDERRWNAKGELVTLSEATIKVDVGNQRIMTVAEGRGPVHALDGALRKALGSAYPTLETLHLVDYKVRILTPEAGTGAVTRVMIESADNGSRWRTVGVSANIIDASFNALNDSLVYKLYRDGARPS